MSTECSRPRISPHCRASFGRILAKASLRAMRAPSVSPSIQSISKPAPRSSAASSSRQIVRAGHACRAGGAEQAGFGGEARALLQRRVFARRRPPQRQLPFDASDARRQAIGLAARARGQPLAGHKRLEPGQPGAEDTLQFRRVDAHYSRTPLGARCSMKPNM